MFALKTIMMLKHPLLVHHLDVFCNADRLPQLDFELIRSMNETSQPLRFRLKEHLSVGSTSTQTLNNIPESVEDYLIEGLSYNLFP